MWNGPGPGPRGGPPFRGDHRGEMFGGREGFPPDFRARDGMNFGPMGHMGPRPHPPMDMRRMGGPPMRGRDLDLHEMHEREAGRDFFRPRNEPDMSFGRHFDMPMRDKPMNPPGFPGPGRDLDNMGGRGMPSREPNHRFMDMRDRDPLHSDMPRFGNPDGRRGFPADRNEPFRDMYDRPPMGPGSADPFNMDLPPHERRMMDTDRRGPPPFNPRGRFDSDMDFRNRPGPPVEFRGRDRSPLQFGKNDVPLVDEERPDLPSNVVPPKRSEFLADEDDMSRRGNLDSSGSPFMDYRSGEELTLAEEWKNRQKDRNPYVDKDVGSIPEPTFPPDFGRNLGPRDPPPFSDREKPGLGFPGKDASFPRRDRFPPLDMPPVGNKGPQGCPLPEMSPLSGHLNRDSKPWLEEKDPKYPPSKVSGAEMPPYQKKNLPPHEGPDPSGGFKGMKDLPHSQSPSTVTLRGEHEFQSSSAQARDQDYRDIDYRTATGRVFEYKHKELQPPEGLNKDSKPVPPSEFTDSASQDQDYRNASMEEKVSNIISVTGIPKSATMEQILGAFAVRDGVPMQGMKIKTVIPGYSYDMAYVEFLNLEDAVHFMESNKASLKVGNRTVSLKYIQPDECERSLQKSNQAVPQTLDPQLPKLNKSPEEMDDTFNGSAPKDVMEQSFQDQWQRSSDLTPEAWQQQVDQQLLEEAGESGLPQSGSDQAPSVFKDSKTMIIKNVKFTTTVESILKALDPFAYLDERNVRLVKNVRLMKCFCFVDMDSHEQVTRLVELLTKPRPLYIDGVRVYAEVAKPLKNQSFRRGLEKPNSSVLGFPPDNSISPYSHPPPFMPPLHPPVDPASRIEGFSSGSVMSGSNSSDPASNPSMNQAIGYNEAAAVAPFYQGGAPPFPEDPAGATSTPDASQVYIYGSETPDMSSYLYDSTSGFYYDPETTLYYDPHSRYFYNAQTQEYLYWDAASKTYIPVPGGYSSDSQPVMMTAEDQAILSNPAADAPLEMKKPSVAPEVLPAPALAASSPPEAVPAATATPDKKEEDEAAKKDKEKDNKDEKPKSLAAVKIMKDMERWAKIQNQKKESCRPPLPSPVLKTGAEDDKRQSKSADVAFAVFERKISGSEDLFKKPVAPAKKDEKSKRPIGSLGMLASEYAAGSDEEVEEDHEEAAKISQPSRPEEKEDKLTDWKKMACLLCRRQFPNKDALVRHQQLSDLHKQNMEIHLKIKRSKKELEALENQEKELNARETTKSPEPKRRKHHHQQAQHQNMWAGSSREMNKVSERPGLGAEPVQPRKKKEPVVWDHATYKQAVRKAMFARFKELD
ncbi:RNA-binding protein 6 isoform X3 [Oryzias melastigma]|uniref:RNA-binding protein 6 isoform X3 n=1 Tax=Oryzias melastigma TaxID=30732 RepID=UPI000CF810D2|nr:RNA-binding protein 6 isoform X3 [Oryzias melastigma]